MRFLNKRLEVLIVISLILAVGFILIRGKLSEPDNAAVNGTYYNKCCGEVAMMNGILWYKNVRHTYDLEDMKFGLTAIVKGTFTRQGIVPSSDSTTLIFQAHGRTRTFATIVSGHEYSFQEVR